MRNKIGTINGAMVANLIDKNNKVLGTTINIPNAVAYAMAINLNVVKSVAHYKYFPDIIRTREELEDRFASVVKLDADKMKKYLKWK